MLIASATLLTSCETDFDVTAEWEDVTIVYGLLNQNDSIHEVKINKAFLGEGNLLQYAAIEDSNIYQQELDVKLLEMDGNTTVREFQLDTTTIHNKEEGIFYHPEQIIYTTGSNRKVFLNDNFTYKLRIENPATGKVVTAETYLVDDFSIDQPRLNSATYPTIHFPVNDNNKEVAWISARNGTLYQLVIYFNFTEFDVNGDSTSRTLRWDSFPSMRSINNNGDQNMSKVFKNSEFYDFVLNNAPYDDQAKEQQVDRRHSDEIIFEISVASDILETYMEVYKPNNSLIQYTPDYTNVDNGLGLFASRYNKTRSFYLQKPTRGYLSDLQIKFVDPYSK